MVMESGFLSGRPFGGIGVLWKKSMCNSCTVKRYDSRLLGFNVITTSGTLFILNVYLPYQCHDNYEEYCHYLSKISAITAECDTTSIIIAGDFNAGKDTQFEEELLDLCDRSHLVVSDTKWCGRDSNTSTYYSASHGTTSWLDHVICSHDTQSQITGMVVHPLPPSSDHHPLGVTLNTSIGNGDTPAKAVNREDYVFPVFNWRKAQDNSINLYRPL